MIGRNMLVMARPGSEEVAQLVVSSAEPSRGSWALEPAHGPVSALDATVILLNPIVHVLTGPMSNPLAQLGADRARVAVVAVGRDPVRRDTRHRLADRKNALAAAMSRRSLNITSTNAPELSMARYK